MKHLHDKSEDDEVKNPDVSRPPPVPVESVVAMRGPLAGEGSKVLLVVTVLAGPVIWAVQLQTGYTLARFECAHPWLRVVHHVANAAFILLAVAAGLLALRDWRRIGRGWPRGGEHPTPGRSRFMSVLAMLLCGLFTLVMIAQWVPLFFIDPCDY